MSPLPSGNIAPALLVPNIANKVVLLPNASIAMTAFAPTADNIAASGDAIFLRSVGDWYNKDIDGDNVNINTASGIVVDDDLFVFIISVLTNESPASSNTTWTVVKTLQSNNVMMFHKVADGDSTDDFLIPTMTSGRNRVAQMACFGNSLPESDLIETQGGVLNETPTGSDWVYGGMSASGPAESLVLFTAGRFRNIDTAVQSQTPNTDIANQIGNIAYEQASPVDTLCAQWGWEYHDTALAMSASGSPLTYASTYTFGLGYTQYNRYRLQ